jgi:hypothetical protein
VNTSTRIGSLLLRATGNSARSTGNSPSVMAVFRLGIGFA